MHGTNDPSLCYIHMKTSGYFLAVKVLRVKRYLARVYNSRYNYKVIMIKIK